MRPLRPVHVMLWMLITFLLCGPDVTQNLPKIPIHLPWISVISEKPPYETKVASCLIIEETKFRGSLTNDQLDVMTSFAEGGVRDYCKKNGIDFQLLDVDNDVSKNKDWVKAAFPVAKEHAPKTEKDPPWMVVADSRTGGSQAVTNTAEALKILSKIKGK